MTDFDVIFQMQSSEFTKSLNFVSNLKKSAKKNLKFFLLKIEFDLFILLLYFFTLNHPIDI